MSAVAEEVSSWVVTELAEAELGDVRRTQRLVEVATMLAPQPGASLPEACGNRAMLKAAYRFFDNEAVDPAEVLASHVQATIPRLASVPVVQDTTDLNWTAHPATTGLGPVGHAQQHGLLAHTTLALTPERVPLGLIAQEIWARDPATIGQRVIRKSRPIKAKESNKWLQSLQAVMAVHEHCPETHTRGSEALSPRGRSNRFIPRPSPDFAVVLYRHPHRRVHRVGR
jgi:Transposase DNA-binding